MFGFEPLVFWGWTFLAIYMGLMILFGFVGMSRIKDSDDFATARGAYGPLFLAFAMTATTASGATFLGLPGLAYSAGLPALWYAFVYPAGVYTGVLVCLHGIRRAGANFGSRSMPEYLGDRFDSNGLRILAALFSLLLLFYLAGQLLAGAVMFTQMLGLETYPALWVTAIVLMFYIALGGAHADILTDGVQGALMLALAGLVLWMFLTGFGVDGGFDGMMARLHELDPALTATLHPTHPLFDSRWDLFAIFVAHLPLGLLPHIGNKLWALKDNRDQVRFITISFVFGMLLPAITCGGVLARALLGDELLAEGSSPNNAIPALFIATLPAWAAALIGAGVLAAVMSTADGLVVSTAQIFANDIFRRTLAPRFMRTASDATVDRIGLLIGRVATIAVLIGAIMLAWSTRDTNIALLVWIGVGGMMAATAAPMFLGVVWRRATRAGAYTGFIVGGAVFSLLHSGSIKAAWFAIRRSNPRSGSRCEDSFTPAPPSVRDCRCSSWSWCRSRPRHLARAPQTFLTDMPGTADSILITGGSTGIGRASALRCAAEGAAVTVADVNDEAGAAVVAEIVAGGGRAQYVHTDVTDAGAVQAVIAAAVQAYGRLDGALNNAGIEGTFTNIVKMSEADYERTVNVDLKGVWLCVKYEVEQMLKQGTGGAIVSTASVAGLIGTRGGSPTARPSMASSA